MIVSKCPHTKRSCGKNKCPFYKKYVIPSINEEGNTECVLLAGYCTVTGEHEAIAEGYCIYE